MEGKNPCMLPLQLHAHTTATDAHVIATHAQVGPGALASWFTHFVALTLYTLAYWVLRPLKRFSRSYAFRRMVDALRWGSGSDYTYRGAGGGAGAGEGAGGEGPAAAAGADREAIAA
jgi:hypothetical protein